MKKHTLKSMTDFVLEQGMNPFQNDVDAWIKTHNYAIFLKQPLKLGMFIPCDENDKPLEEPIISEFLLDRPNGTPIKSKNTPEAYKYRKAKERVLFKGFSIIKEGENTILKHNDTNVWLNWNKRCIEDLVRISPELTETVKKEIGL